MDNVGKIGKTMATAMIELESKDKLTKASADRGLANQQAVDLDSEISSRGSFESASVSTYQHDDPAQSGQ